MDIGGLLPLVTLLTNAHLPAPLREAIARSAFDKGLMISNQALTDMLVAIGGQQLLVMDLRSSNSSLGLEQIASQAIYWVCNGRGALCQQMSQMGPWGHWTGEPVSCSPLWLHVKSRLC